MIRTASKPPFRKILVANRGEIALRVIRACRELGIPTVAVYSTCDVHSPHVRFADEAICIGPPDAARSYLNVPAVLSAAEVTGADAIHPGYGFLAENADFARKVIASGLTFIGPDPEVLTAVGDKLRAKEVARRAGVPLLPGSTGAVTDVDEALEVAASVGFPVMLKAAGGGGGKGMRVVRDGQELAQVLPTAMQEAQAAFGSSALFIERFLDAPRHIEVQVAGDRQGSVIHLFERDCSLQRRHQKLWEEAPAPNLPPDLAQAIREAAARLAAEVGYHTVGTVEFLVQDGEFYFLEVNPRIQVEHPVTEQVTGVDLVQLQVELAAGRPLPLAQEDVSARGHAIEVRINAEDSRRFLPSPGRIDGLHLPGGPGVRVDAALYEGAVVQPYYDSLVAKLVVHGVDRAAALARLRRALHEAVVEGVQTTLDLFRELVDREEVHAVTYDTRSVERWVAADAAG